ncbi:MAG: prepilin-type N-terminal cleavage/methylation domain-containing protein, partial [Candidatus Rokuibacteriota bacterium]
MTARLSRCRKGCNQAQQLLTDHAGEANPPRVIVVFLRDAGVGRPTPSGPPSMARSSMPLNESLRRHLRLTRGWHTMCTLVRCAAPAHEVQLGRGTDISLGTSEAESMTKFWHKQRRPLGNQRGFTLIELMIVVAI